MAKKIKIPEHLDDNKELLFDLMKEYAVATVTVNFNGEGDSGQIDEVEAGGNEDFLNTDLEGVKISNGLRYVPGGYEVVWQTGPCKVRALIESVCYTVLEQEYGGWENNEGAYGTFTFDGETRKGSFEIHQRYTEVNTDNRTF